jgi:hypothetical protein
MNRSNESTPRTYTEAELAGLFATYFGDKLTQSQIDSLVATVAEAHANRRARAAESADLPGASISDGGIGPLTTGQGSIARFFATWAPG